jgi:hypothetical protein
MDFLTRWFRRPPSGRVHVVDPVMPTSAYVKAELRQYGLRPARWVVVDGTKAGILTGLRDGVARVMLVDWDGFDIDVVERPAGDVRQAWYDEIPAKRRPDEARAVAMGYVKR